MADGKTRIYSLPEVTEVNSDMYIMLDSGATGTRRYNLKTMYDKVDGVTDAAEAAEAATETATTAAASATSAASAATTAATQAQSTVQQFMADATETMDGLVDDVNDALDAIGDISEQAVPLMSPTTRGGAKLGHGLAIEDGALGIGEVTDPTDAGPIVALSAKGWATQDGTPSPDSPVEIQVARGRNLLRLDGRVTRPTTNSDPSSTKTMDGNGLWPSIASNGYVRDNVSGVSVSDGVIRYTSASASYGVGFEIVLKPNTTYVASFVSTNGELRVSYFTTNGVYVSSSSSMQSGSPFTTPASFAYALLIFIPKTANTTTMVTDIQLELGSTATPYVPYGCVGVDVYDGSTHVATIPIPLPSRGWVAALPDGTCDTLALDGAGGFTWEMNTSEVTYDGSETWVFSNGYSDTSNGRYCYYESNGLLNHLKTDNANRLSNRFRAVTNAVIRENKEIGTFSLSAHNLKGNVTLMTEYATLADFNAWLQSNHVTVLYPLATPTTESGYVDSMPTVPVHAAISSVDLVDLTVRCCADEGAAEIASAWGRKYESRIANLESAVAELIAGA